VGVAYHEFVGQNLVIKTLPNVASPCSFVYLCLFHNAHIYLFMIFCWTSRHCSMYATFLNLRPNVEFDKLWLGLWAMDIWFLRHAALRPLGNCSFDLRFCFLRNDITASVLMALCSARAFDRSAHLLLICLLCGKGKDLDICVDDGTGMVEG